MAKKNKKENKGNAPCHEKKQKQIHYTVDKITFIVTPLYRETGETIDDILLKLMKHETEKP
jgi:hypothetical protein